ncbi:hypothetical protein T4A_7474 [Trichinella pseudospiralis]|uniref:C2H2-type domain-containing protein n=1 Tax=Trichinella pseudospiralis TaxID=6337 RepID=A0A0V1DZU9_TRIPS|nr:hypothetical protein T4A_7474 [Trichinella pseudospiralis]
MDWMTQIQLAIFHKFRTKKLSYLVVCDDKEFKQFFCFIFYFECLLSFYPRGHKIAEDALNVSMSMNGERNAVCVAVRRKTSGARTAKKGFPFFLHRGGVPETVAQLAPWLMNHGSDTHSGLKPYVCEDDGCQRAYCGRSSLQQHMKRVEFKSYRYNGRCIRGWLEFQPKTRIEVSERQAKTCLRPLRYNGGTCNGRTDATFESETKDVFMNARMRTAVLLSNPIDELWQYTQRLVAICVFRGLLSACLVIAATAYEDVLINLGFGSRASWK